MRTEKFRQIACISAPDAEVFEMKMNAVLGRVTDPEIIIDPHRSFTAIIIYSISRNLPDTLLELLESIYGDHKCKECQYFQQNHDMRRVWHKCLYNDQQVRENTSCCIQYYKEKIAGSKIIEALDDEIAKIPYTIE